MKCSALVEVYAPSRVCPLFMFTAGCKVKVQYISLFFPFLEPSELIQCSNLPGMFVLCSEKGFFPFLSFLPREQALRKCQKVK